MGCSFKYTVAEVRYLDLPWCLPYYAYLIMTCKISPRAPKMPYLLSALEKLIKSDQALDITKNTKFEVLI